MGSNRTLKVDVRIIAATNANLEENGAGWPVSGMISIIVSMSFPWSCRPYGSGWMTCALLADYFLKNIGEKNRREGIDPVPGGASGLPGLSLAGKHPGVGKRH